ncbi:MAG: rhodanese-like domain-containing protein [Ignavibacteria bacterium]|nr:MAG: rhodanese-like domain-containing protein [Ignavibacteria bacterium]KAF0161048.1 MAG: rhodanese-like domain-containing protein [Ignavibacteria bacterium]
MLSSLFNRINVSHLDAETFAKQVSIQPNAVILDVRTEEEHFTTRIPNSILIDIYEETFPDEVLKLDKNKSYFVYCRSGSRSNTACKFMLKNGFTNVYNLEDGIISWKGKLQQS